MIEEIFGILVAHVYIIELQKRDLLYTDCAVFLERKSKDKLNSFKYMEMGME